uniref:Endonuclease V n=1 Tax=Salix viminalis TaxID=40686 RepID=A0A6N2KID3_SALVM
MVFVMDGSGESSSIEPKISGESMMLACYLIQDLLKERLITQDDFPWKLPIPSSSGNVAVEEGGGGGALLKYVGGVDVSYSKELDSAEAASTAACGCGSLVVLDVTTPLCKSSTKISFHSAYILPFLLSERSLHHVDGLTESGVRQLLQAKDNSGEDFITLTGSCCAMRSTKGSCKPIYVSVGHRVSLNTAIKIMKMICKYRVPEPIRQADIRSRDHLQKNSGGNDGTLQ